jgi:hypothetical protein
VTERHLIVDFEVAYKRRRGGSQAEDDWQLYQAIRDE